MSNTSCVDQGICPACKGIFNAAELVNYSIGTTFNHCPHCGQYLEIYTSVEYQCSIPDEGEEYEVE